MTAIAPALVTDRPTNDPPARPTRREASPVATVAADGHASHAHGSAGRPTEPAAAGAPSRMSPRSAASAVASAAAGTVTGRVVLLGATAGEGGRVTDAVVYLEPLQVAAAPRPAVRPAPVVEAPGAPADSVRLLWNATRELGSAVREVRDGLTALRLALGAGRTPPTPRAEPAPLAAVQALERAGRPAPAPIPVAVAEPEAPAIPAPVATRVAMDMRGKEFRPHVRVVGTGSAVEWPNRDPFSHNVFSNTPGGAFDLGLYPRGESRDAAFRRPGVYEIFCNIHPRMSAFVVAVPTPYHAQPARDGRFSLAGVVPGRYRLRVWHERAREQSQLVTVEGDGAREVQVTLDARTYRPAQHPNKFGQPYTTTGRDEY